MGIIFTLIEILCYIIIFHHIFHHNTNIAAVVLSEKVIKQRNRTNAISFFGQFVAWIMRFWFLFLFLVTNTMALPVVIKNFEFVLIPLVEMYTSAPIRSFRNQK